MTLSGIGYTPPKAIQVDPYGPNPLVTDLSARNPALFKVASDRSPAPTLFATGDLPPFTASGVDPQLLQGLPYNWRHNAASETDPVKVLAMLEQSAQDPGNTATEAMPAYGFLDYQVRIERWTSGLTTPDVTMDDAAYPDSFWTGKPQS